MKEEFLKFWEEAQAGKVFLRRRQDPSGKIYIFDEVRGQWVVQTPEEIIRQLCIRCLREVFGVPPLYIAAERGVARLRTDIIAFNRGLKPALVVECKRMHAPLNIPVFLQADRYVAAPSLSTVRFLWITNGIHHFFAQRVHSRWTSADMLPPWDEW